MSVRLKLCASAASSTRCALALLSCSGTAAAYRKAEGVGEEAGKEEDVVSCGTVRYSAVRARLRRVHVLTSCTVASVEWLTPNRAAASGRPSSHSRLTILSTSLPTSSPFPSSPSSHLPSARNLLPCAPSLSPNRAPSRSPPPSLLPRPSPSLAASSPSPLPPPPKCRLTCSRQAGEHTPCAFTRTSPRDSLVAPACTTNSEPSRTTSPAPAPEPPFPESAPTAEPGAPRAAPPAVLCGAEEREARKKVRSRKPQSFVASDRSASDATSRGDTRHPHTVHPFALPPPPCALPCPWVALLPLLAAGVEGSDAGLAGTRVKRRNDERAVEEAEGGGIGGWSGEVGSSAGGRESADDDDDARVAGAQRWTGESGDERADEGRAVCRLASTMSTSAGDGGESAARTTTACGGGGGGGDLDASCWYSRVERRKCRLVRDEDGRPVRECERTQEVLRQCVGRPSEVVESHSEVTREELPPGSTLSSSSSSSFSSSSSSFSYGGGGTTSTHPSPDTPSLQSPFSHFPFSLPSPFSSRPPPSLPPSDPHSSSAHQPPYSPWSSSHPHSHPGGGPSPHSLPTDLPSLPDMIRAAEQLASEVLTRFGISPPTGFPGSGDGEQGSGSGAGGSGGPWSVFRFGTREPSTQIWEDESSVLDGSGVGSGNSGKHGTEQRNGQGMEGGGGDGRWGKFGRWRKGGDEEGGWGWREGHGKQKAKEEEKYREFAKDFEDV
ncbi:unnamed protein product [Closterium sp. NIES-53]